MSEKLTKSARPGPQPEANLGYLFRLAHQRFRARLDSELEHLGLSAQEYGILSVFESRPELSTSELARISQVTRQTMHTSVLSLESAGLRRSSGRAGLADRGATPVRTPAAERENRGVAHARDRPVPPPTSRECPQQRRARRDHDTHDLHPRIRR